MKRGYLVLEVLLIGVLLVNFVSAGWTCDWVDVQSVFSGEVSIPSHGLLKLDVGKDSLGNRIFPGFNNLDVSLNEVGDYRVYARFSRGADSVETSWEFSVV